MAAIANPAIRDMLKRMAATLDTFAVPEGYRVVLILLHPDDPGDTLIAGNAPLDVVRRNLAALAIDETKGIGIASNSEVLSARKDLG